MTDLKPPNTPIPDWQAVRDAWVRDVQALVAEADGWCRAEGWATRAIPRRIADRAVGDHVAPALLIQVELVQLLLEPVSPRVPGADGVLDLYLMPRYDDIASIYRHADGWRVNDSREWTASGDVSHTPGRPFGREVFIDTVNRMVADARQRAV